MGNSDSKDGGKAEAGAADTSGATSGIPTPTSPHGSVAALSPRPLDAAAVVLKFVEPPSAEALTAEINELRAVYNSITSGSADEGLEFRDILRCPEVRTQLDFGDLELAALEASWLAAAAAPGAAVAAAAAAAPRPGEAWGIGSRLSFWGFLEFLCLCEQAVGLRGITSEAAVAKTDRGAELLLARRRVQGFIRATLTVHYRGPATSSAAASAVATGTAADATDANGDVIATAEQLRASIIRAALLSGLSHRESVQALETRGLYKHSSAAAMLEVGLHKAELGRQLKRQPSYGEVVAQGILLEQTPNQHHLEVCLKRDLMKHGLQKRRSKEDLLAAGIMRSDSPAAQAAERCFLQNKLNHDLTRRSSRGELVQQGILVDVRLPGQDTLDHKLAGARLSRQLQRRPSVEELKAGGVYQTPVQDRAAHLEHELHKDALRQALERRPSAADLKAAGLLVATTPQQLHAERMVAARLVKHGLERRESLEDLVRQGIYKQQSPTQADMFQALVARNLKHDLARRESLEGLRQQGIYQSPIEARRMELEHEQTRDALRHSLMQRADIASLRAQGIYRDGNGKSLALKRSFLSDQLSAALRARPELRDLEARGLIDAEALKNCYEGLVAGAADGCLILPALLEWPELRDAVEKGVTTAAAVSDAFPRFATAANPAAADGGGAAGLDAAGFSALLAALPAAGPAAAPAVDSAPEGGESADGSAAGPSLKRWILDAIAGAWAEREHHEAMRRRNAIMAGALEGELKRRESMEELVNKGIYINMTPQQVGVDRAHVAHVLAHRLSEARRPSAADLAAHGMLLLDVSPDELREQRRNARNGLESALSRRPDHDAIEAAGYLEVDELHETYRELCGSGSVAPTVAALLAWGPACALMEAGGAMEDAVATAAAAAAAAAAASGDDAVGFESFLRFIHDVDLHVDALDVEAREGDSDEQRERKQRLCRKRERASAAAAAAGTGAGPTSLKEMLVRHLQRRPPRAAPTTLRLARSFVLPAAAALEHKFAADCLSHALQSRPAPEDLRARGVWVPSPAAAAVAAAAVSGSAGSASSAAQGGAGVGEAETAIVGGGGGGRAAVEAIAHTAVARELVFGLNQALVARRLARRPSMEAMLNKGLLHHETAAQERLTHLIARDAVKHRLSGRPDLGQLEARGIYRPGQSSAGIALGLLLHQADLSRALARRPSHAELELRGVLQSHEDVARPSTEMNDRIGLSVVRKDIQGPLSDDESQRLTPHMATSAAAEAIEAAQAGLALHTPDERDRLVAEGILRAAMMPNAAALDRCLKEDMLKHQLERREDLPVLVARGIHHGAAATPRAAELERAVLADRLKHSLAPARRPSLERLVQQGILLPLTPEEHSMARYLSMRNLKHGLEAREELDSLKAQGIYQEAGSGRHGSHDKLLRRALLSRTLSARVRPEELARLRQKGVYIDAEHGRLKAQRGLIAAQLARLMRERPSPEQLQADRPRILDESDLAVAFQQHCSVAGSAAATAAEDAMGTEGTSETVSLEALRAWPAVQEYLSSAARSGGEAAAAAMVSYFELVDHDGDGEITFSEFLKWVELCDLNPEDHAEVANEQLENAFRKLAADGTSIPLPSAAEYPLARRWATSAGMDHKAVAAAFLCLRGGVAGASERSEGASAAAAAVDVTAFLAGCHTLQTAAAEAHAKRLLEARERAAADGSEAKASLKARLVRKLRERPDYADLRIKGLLLDGTGAAAALLERNLISNHLKQQLLQRPALAELERAGYLLPDDTHEAHVESGRRVEEALSMRHDDAAWKARPGAHRREVSAQLQAALERRAPVEQLENKGIMLVGEAQELAYVLLLDAVVTAQRGFKVSPSHMLQQIKDGSE